MAEKEMKKICAEIPREVGRAAHCDAPQNWVRTSVMWVWCTTESGVYQCHVGVVHHRIGYVPVSCGCGAPQNRVCASVMWVWCTTESGMCQCHAGVMHHRIGYVLVSCKPRDDTSYPTPLKIHNHQSCPGEKCHEKDDSCLYVKHEGNSNVNCVPCTAVVGMSEGEGGGGKHKAKKI